VIIINGNNHRFSLRLANNCKIVKFLKSTKNRTNKTYTQILDDLIPSTIEELLTTQWLKFYDTAKSFTDTNMHRKLDAINVILHKCIHNEKIDQETINYLVEMLNGDDD
jgi:hypothetical protein